MIKKIICFLFWHQWVAGYYEYYDAESGSQKYICKRCGKLKNVWITKYL